MKSKKLRMEREKNLTVKNLKKFKFLELNQKVLKTFLKNN
jgi:hypothetical protein